MGSGNDGRTLTHTEGIWLSASRNLECSDMEDYYNRPARGGGEEHGVRQATFGLAGGIPADCRIIRGMSELVFEVVQEADGGYCAECLTENIFTEGDTWEQLRKNVLEATAAFFFDRPRPERIRLHLVRDEILSVA